MPRPTTPLVRPHQVLSASIWRAVVFLCVIFGTGTSALAQEGPEFWFALPRSRAVRNIESLSSPVHGSEGGNGVTELTLGHSGYGLEIRNDDPAESAYITLEHFAGTPQVPEGAPASVLAYVNPTVQDPDQPAQAWPLSEIRDFAIEPHSSVMLMIPRGPTPQGQPMLELEDDTAIQSRSLHLTATRPVSLVVFNRSPYFKLHNDAYRVFPTANLGTTYQFMTWGDGSQHSAQGEDHPRVRLTAIAAEAGTVLEIFAPDDPSPPRRVILTPGYAYQFESQSLYDRTEPEPTGPGHRFEHAVRVNCTTGKRFAMIASSDAATWSTSGWWDRGAALDQGLPEPAWEQDYLIPVFPLYVPGGNTESLGTTIKIVAKSADTRVALYSVINDPSQPGQMQCDGDPDPATIHWLLPTPPAPHDGDLVSNDPAFYDSQTLLSAAILQPGESFEPLNDDEHLNPNGTNWRPSFLHHCSSATHDQNVRLVRVCSNHPVEIIIGGTGTKAECLEGEPFQMTVLPAGQFAPHATVPAMRFFSNRTFTDAAGQMCVCPSPSNLTIPDPWSHYAVIIRRAGSGDVDIADASAENPVYLTLNPATCPRFSGWKAFPSRPGLSGYELGWYTIFKDCDIDVPEPWPHGLIDLSIKAHNAGDTIGVYFVAVSDYGTVGFPAWLPPPVPPTASYTLTENLSTIAQAPVELVPGSIVSPRPVHLYLEDGHTQAPTPESAKVLVWDLDPSLPINTMQEFQYRVMFHDPAPSEHRQESSDTVLAVPDPLIPTQTAVRQYGPSYVDFLPSPAQIAIAATPHPPDVCVTPALEHLHTTVTFPSNSFMTRRAFADAADFTASNVALTQLDPGTVERPGGLVLSRATTAFLSSGTAKFTMDVGRTVHWISTNTVAGSELRLQSSLSQPGAIEIRTRSGISLAALELPGHENDWWSPWVPATGSVPIAATDNRVLQVQVRMTASTDLLVSPCLEELDIGYSSNTLAVEVQVEDPAQGQSPGSLVALVARHELTPADLAQQFLNFQDDFPSSSVIPGPYVARATLVDLANGHQEVTATDNFTTAENQLDLGNQVTTDRDVYWAGDTAQITSVVQNRASNRPLQYLWVRVHVRSPGGGEMPGSPYIYRIDDLPSGQSDINVHPFPISGAFAPAQGYAVEQDVYRGNDVVGISTANFSVRSSSQYQSALAGTLRITPAGFTRPHNLSGILSMSVTNVGNVPLHQLRLLVTFAAVNGTSLPPLDQFYFRSDLPPGARLQVNRPFYASRLTAAGYQALASGAYVATLEAISYTPDTPPQPIRLATTGFNVREGSGPGGPGEPQTPLYFYHNLGTLPGFGSSSAAAINSFGDIVGTAGAPIDTLQAAIWKCRVISSLSAGTGSVSAGINGLGSIVGRGNVTSGQPGAFIIEPNGSVYNTIFLPLLSGWTFPSANGVNTLGARSMVVGSALNSAGHNLAVRWARATSSGNYVPSTFTLPEMTDSNGYAINDNGDMVGTWSASGSSSITRGLLIQDGVAEDLGQFDDNQSGQLPYTQTVPKSINGLGLSVGYAMSPVGTTPTPRPAVPVALQEEVMWRLDGPLSFTGDLYATSVNNYGLAVGYRMGVAAPGPSQRGCAWFDNRFFDLRDVMMHSGSDEPSIANCVNDHGDIVGTAATSGSSQAFWAEPLPFSKERYTNHLKFWCRSDDDISVDATSHVLGWSDLSPTKLDLTPVSTNQTFVNLKPQDCCSPPMVLLNGNGAMLTTSTASPALTSSDMTLAFVLDSSTSDHGPVISGIGTSQGDALQVIHLDNGQMQVWVGTTLAASAAVDRATSVWEIRITGAQAPFQISVFRDGRNVVEDVINAAPPTINGLRIGAALQSGSIAFGLCTVREVALFSAALPSYELDQLTSYLEFRAHIGSPGNDLPQPGFLLQSDSGVTLQTNTSLVTSWLDQSGAARLATLPTGYASPSVVGAAIRCFPGVSFTPVNAALAVPEQPQPADVVLLIDASPSMDNPHGSPNSRFEVARRAAHSFASAIFSSGTSNRVGVVAFSNAATVVSPVGATSQAVLAAIDDPQTLAVNPSATGTNYIPALIASEQQFAASSGRRCFVVLLSDGGAQDQFNYDPSIMDKVVELHAPPYIASIFSVGLPGVDPDSSAASLLQEMAYRSGGQYVAVGTNPDVGPALAAMARLVSLGGADATMSFVIKPDADNGQTGNQLVAAINGRDDSGAPAGMTVYTRPYVPLGGTSQRRVFVHLWSAAGSATLIAPSAITTDPVHLEVTAQTSGEAMLYSAMLNNVPLAMLTAADIPRVYFRMDGMRVGGPGDASNLHFDQAGVALPFRGSISEIGVYPGALDPSQRLAIRLGLARKYGLTSLVNEPPVAVAGGTYTVYDLRWDGQEPVHLNGSGSVDPDGLLTDPDSYEWLEGGAVIGVGMSPTIPFSLGTHTVVLRVTDGFEATDQDTATVKVLPITTGVIADWCMDGLSTSNYVVPDCSPNRFDANLHNYAPGTFSNGRHDGGLDLSLGAYVTLDSIATQQALPGGSAVRSVCFWFATAPGTSNGPGVIFEQADTGSSPATWAASLLRVSAYVPSNTGSTPVALRVQLGTDLRGTSVSRGWHHVAMVIPPGAGWSDEIDLYVDGVRTPAAPISGAPCPINTGTSYALIGHPNAPFGYSAGNDLAGRVDDVRLYATALSASDIVGIMNEAPVAQWPVEKVIDPPGAIADTTAAPGFSGNPFVLAGGALGKQEPTRVWALSLPTSLSGGRSDTPLWSTDQDFTLAIWVYMSSTTGSDPQAGAVFASEKGTEIIPWLQTTPSGKILTSLVDGQPQSFGASISLNKWHHAVIVKTATGVSLYLNGSAAGNLDVGSLAPSTTGRLRIAESGFVGYVDDIRVYPVAMNSEQIKLLYSRTKLP